jgi:3-oxoacyl-[acyl-carrier protein] reductase
MAGNTRAKVLRNTLTDLNKTDCTMMMPLWDDPVHAGLFSNRSKPKDAQVTDINLSRVSNHKFKGLIFDATGMESVQDLKALYLFFSQSLKHLRQGGRVILFAYAPESCETAEQTACMEACKSFIRSTAKEVGHKGANANIIELMPGSEKLCFPTLTFLLSRKSAYISGQILSITKARSVPPVWHKPLAGKTALVTGAANGIGAETARVLARDGAVVVCLDIPQNQAPLTQFASNIGGHAISLNLLDEGAVTELAKTLTSQMGIIDIVVHNAGITRDKTLKNMSSDQWNSVLNLNLEKIVQINKKLMDIKALNKNARIVGVSSISGIAGNFGQTNYAASKGGLAGYTRAMAKQASDGITFNAVAPGFIETQMTAKVPLIPREVGRRSNAFSQGGLPLDVAEAIAFFCQPSSQALNGNVLRVCGQSLLGR